MKNFLHAIFHTVFWVWNIAFLFIVSAGLLPQLGVYLLEENLADPWITESLLTLAILIVVSTMATAVGLRRFRAQPLQLMRLFFGVEVPLLLLCLLRLFIWQRLNPASTLILGTAVVGIVAFYLELLYGYARRNRAIASIQVIAHTFLIGLSVYAGLVILSYSVPATPALVLWFFTFEWVKPLMESWNWEYWWAGAGGILLGFSAFLFLLFPFELGSSYIRSGHRVLKAFAEQYGQKKALQIAIAGLTAWLVLFLSFLQQPQIQAFKLLSSPPETDRDRQALVAKSDVIRAGLLNAYLADYRYLGYSENSYYITDTFLPEPIAQFWREANNCLFAPFLYQGSYNDRERAEKLYAQFFDTPIEKAEADTIRPILRIAEAPWRQSPEASLLAIDQENVWLRSQQLKVTEQGDWAEVELYEVYQNETPQQQEIRYAFTLPETAVLTGIWLGDTANLDQRFVFQVSPRGAAEQVYTTEVRRRVDPALLEQVGPQQYRLRAFPIPPKPLPGAEVPSDRPTEMHLWLTYKVMRQPQGWALPQLTEKRNVFWNRKTQRLYNGQSPLLNQVDWLPAFLPAIDTVIPLSHQVELGNYQVSVKPVTLKDYTSLQNKRFAVVVDSSYSMSARAKELNQTVEWLKQHGFADNNLANNDADLYITGAANAKPQRIDDIRQFNPAKIAFYGTLQPTQMLRQYSRLQGDTAYDGVLLLTDGGSYELGKNQQKAIATLSAPLWMVHLGEQPIAYDDTILKIIQANGGGTASDLPTALQRQATQAALGPEVVTVADGYAWFVEKPASPPTASPDTSPSESAQDKPASNQAKPPRFTPKNPDTFAPLAARQLILALSKDMANPELAQLDTVHAIAKQLKIVSPYSSMIVLVNDEQREALRQAELNKDRFNRVGDNDSPENMESTPEPGIILAIAAIALLLISRRPRRRLVMR
ncbi:MULTISPECIES: TIGR02921 family PEP-CTERM protein [Trichocoleus]|uniref:TIGR02921 family PEP-CTERM protein n=1 Tax=Trichocoleus desertorum GB2-A4 TaxID=2933944 RepID=A0ABV0J6P5_9CYAN|nr:TIGR02921 family PEP-CTERM protein [Trichocoleus sp. FACHB-46]MBD1862416.1 TIGR02921 family PEP-CTERM protein [Trichocoleus sp. FACHB-46]